MQAKAGGWKLHCEVASLVVDEANTAEWVTRVWNLEVDERRDGYGWCGWHT